MQINTEALNDFAAKFYNGSTELTNEDLRADIASNGAPVTFGETGTGKVSRWGRRMFVPSDAENLHLKEISRQFFQSVKAIFGDETDIPKTIQDAMGVHDRADGKMRPLSLRRIRIVHEAIENLAEVRKIREQQQAQVPAAPQPELTDEEQIQATINKNLEDFMDYDPEAESQETAAAARDFQACLLRRLQVKSADIEAFLSGTKTIDHITFAKFVTDYVDQKDGLHEQFDQRYQTLSNKLEGTAKKAFELWYTETCGAEKNPYAQTAKSLGLTFSEPESEFLWKLNGTLADNIREENAHQWLTQSLNAPARELNEIFDKLASYQTSSVYQSLQTAVTAAINTKLAEFGAVTEAEKAAVLKAATAKLEERMAKNPAELLEILQGVDKTEQISDALVSTAVKTLRAVRTDAIEQQVRAKAQQTLAEMANSLRKSVVFNTLRENGWSTMPTLSDADYDKILEKIPGFTKADFTAAMNKHLASCVAGQMRDQNEAVENYIQTGSFSGSTSLSEQRSGSVYNEELTAFMEFSRGICQVEPCVGVPFKGQILSNTVAIKTARAKTFTSQELPALKAFANTLATGSAIPEIFTEKDGASTMSTRLVWLTAEQRIEIAQSNKQKMEEQLEATACTEYKNLGEIGPACGELKTRFAKLAGTLNDLLVPKFNALYERLTDAETAFTACGVKKLVVKSTESRTTLGLKLGAALSKIYAELYAHPTEYVESTNMLAYSKIYTLCRTAINEVAADEFVRRHLSNQGFTANTETLTRLLTVFP